MFHIDVNNFHWINDNGKDDPSDLCLHGYATAVIGEEFLEYESTVSAAGLYFLRTLTENHIMYSDQPIFPCCGHFMIANKELDSVDIAVGCPNGVDFSVIHDISALRCAVISGEFEPIARITAQCFTHSKELIFKVYYKTPCN